MLSSTPTRMTISSIETIYGVFVSAYFVVVYYYVYMIHERPSILGIRHIAARSGGTDERV
jgi:hypothetical protein